MCFIVPFQAPHVVVVERLDCGVEVCDVNTIIVLWYDNVHKAALVSLGGYLPLATTAVGASVTVRWVMRSSSASL